MLCSREGCPNTFQPRGPRHRFCSKRCRQIDHESRHPEMKLARDLRSWHRTGWYVRHNRRLKRRIQQRLEEVHP